MKKLVTLSLATLFLFASTVSFANFDKDGKCKGKCEGKKECKKEDKKEVKKSTTTAHVCSKECMKNGKCDEMKKTKKVVS